MIQSHLVTDDALATETPGVPLPPPVRTTSARVSAAFEVVLVSGFPTQLALGVVLLAVGVRPRDSVGGLSMSYLVSVLLLDAVIIAAFILVALRARGESAAGLFLGLRPPAREAWIGLALVPLVVGGTTALLALVRLGLPALHNVPINPFEALIHTPTDAVILGLAAVLGGGVKEELQRAFILHRFDQHLGGARLGLVLYSLVFGAGHAIQGWDVGVLTAVLGLAWGTVFLWRRSAVAPIVSHCGFNAAQIVQFLIVSA